MGGRREAVGGRRGEVERKKKFSTLNSSKDRTYTASPRRLEAPRRGVIDVLYNQLVCLSVHREELGRMKLLLFNLPMFTNNV